jgi:hypothetical protein
MTGRAYSIIIALLLLKNTSVAPSDYLIMNFFP